MTGLQPDLPRAPDLIEAVVGFRQWRLNGDTVRSLFQDDVWAGATLTAFCSTGRHPDHLAPVNDCSCGTHAWYTPCPRLGSAATSSLVAGAVVLWGRIELHATGMRGQHCRIVALALPLSRGAKRRRVLTVAERLGVPAVSHRELGHIAQIHGSGVPDQLRPAQQPTVAAGNHVGVVPRLVHSATGAASGRVTSTSGRKA